MIAERRHAPSALASLCLIGTLFGASDSVLAQCSDGPPVARLVSTHGRVLIGERRGVRGSDVCAGSIVRTGGDGRAVVLVATVDTVVRLDRDTRVRIHAPPVDASDADAESTESLLDLLEGALHFFSRTPLSIGIDTPFVNSGIEGTELAIRHDVAAEVTTIQMLEGTVRLRPARGPDGRPKVAFARAVDRLRAGESRAFHRVRVAGAEAMLESKPVPVRPREAVHWAIYYPPVLAAVTEPGDPVQRASQLLAAGNVDAAEAALGGSSGDPRARAVRAVIAVAQGDPEGSLRLANEAVALGRPPVPAAARIARSYAYQGLFRLREAREDMERAVADHPSDALAWARLSELSLMFGDLGAARAAAARAATIQTTDPGRADWRNPAAVRTATVLGFAELARLDVEAASAAFERAIALDEQDPLPRLGLGLALIRSGALRAGIESLETAVSLDANSSLVRSYLGKAFFEADRGADAAKELGRARDLDPNDPTPWFYDAIRKQAENRPVEALLDLEESIAKNGNRAVYRSRLLLDEDLAVRGARLGRIYRDLGFEQLALVEGWKSLERDPGNHAAHRLLADTYSVLPRHAIARDSELLQSQLLQPLNLNPVQPRLADNGLAVLDDTSPADVGFNEFSRVFESNQLRLVADVLAGGNDTFADNVIQSGVFGDVSYSVGQFHYETQGFRVNNGLRQDIYNAFLQVNVSHDTSLQMELRTVEEDIEDERLLFDPANFSPTFEEKFETRTFRVGARHRFTPGSVLIGSWMTSDFVDDFRPDPFLTAVTEEQGNLIEMRHILERGPVRVNSGLGYFHDDVEDSITFGPFPPFDETSSVRHRNAYVYSAFDVGEYATFTVGASVDELDEGSLDFERDQINPKLGLTWTPLSGLTVRAAAFRVLKRPVISSQTIEPTNVAGFNQFFDDANGSDTWRYGVAVDWKPAPRLFAGAELSYRDIASPTIVPGPTLSVTDVEYIERTARAYLNWTPTDRISTSIEYRLEDDDRDPRAANPGVLAEATTHRVPVEIRYFSPGGLFATGRATWIDQNGMFGRASGAIERGSDRFVVADLALGYRLPNRRGSVAFEVRNVFDERFNFQDTDPINATVSPERLGLFRLTLAF